MVLCKQTFSELGENQFHTPSYAQENNYALPVDLLHQHFKGYFQEGSNIQAYTPSLPAILNFIELYMVTPAFEDIFSYLLAL